MNYYVFNYTNKNGEQKEIKLRLSSGDAMEIENIKKKSIIEFLQEESMSMMITMLRYLRKSDDKNFSLGQAQSLYDELIDSGLSMKRILIDVIYEALVVSGFLEKSEWEEVKNSIQRANNNVKKTLSME
jgi:hypothetical protein